MSSNYEEILKKNIERLSKIDAELEELGKMRRFFDKINEQELAIQRLTDLCKDFVREKELKELKTDLEKRVESCEKALREGIKRLSETDAKIIDDLSKIARIGAPSKPKTKSLEELRKEKEGILAMLDTLREEYEEKLISKEGYEESLKVSEKRLSEINAEIEELRKT